MPGSFFDSNVLLYALSDDTGKAERSEELIRAGGTISVQVLNEIANVTRRKLAMSWSEIHVFLSLIRRLTRIEPITVETHDAGLALAERYRLSVYDGMIAASALDSDCDILWSEDMQDGMLLDGRLTITNPFRANA